MMIVGRIFKHLEAGAPPWAVEVDAIGAATQGRSLKDAIRMLIEWVQLKCEFELKRPGVAVSVTILGETAPDDYEVLVEAEPALLAALVLRYQRRMRGLTLQQVAAKLGATHHNAYASYEQGKREPSLGKFAEMLAAVAPEMGLTLGPRLPARAATPRPRPKRKTARRRAG
jgi:DNA-binding XRE family transcriptional regulator